MDNFTGNNDAQKVRNVFYNPKAKNVIYSTHFLDSKAYTELKPSSRKLFEEFLKRIDWKSVPNLGKKKKGKKYVWIMANKNKLIFPYSEMLVSTGYKSRATISASIRQLVENGIIDIIHSGQAHKRNDYSIYGISDRWQLYGKPNFVFKTLPKDTRRGESLRKYQKLRNEKMKNDLLKIANFEAKSLNGDLIEIVLKTNSTMKTINSNKKRYIKRRIKKRESI